MRHFKLNCLSITAGNDRILRQEKDEVYSEKDIGKRLFDKYLETGHIVQTDEKGKPVKGDKKASGAEAYDEISKKELQAKLDELGVEYDDKANKQTLYELYTSS